MPDAPEPKDRKPLVLLVEDDDSLSRLRAFALEERGLEVHVSGTLGEALDALGEAPGFDAVLTDVKLSDRPGDQGGIELARTIRESFGDIPVVAYTAFYAGEEITDAEGIFIRHFTKGSTGISGIEKALDEISELARESRRRRER
jgi:CheY-like chemotaxis protein